MNIKVLTSMLSEWTYEFKSIFDRKIYLMSKAFLRSHFRFEAKIKIGGQNLSRSIVYLRLKNRFEVIIHV